MHHFVDSDTWSLWHFLHFDVLMCMKAEIDHDFWLSLAAKFRGKKWSILNCRCPYSTYFIRTVALLDLGVQWKFFISLLSTVDNWQHKSYLLNDWTPSSILKDLGAGAPQNVIKVALLLYKSFTGYIYSKCVFLSVPSIKNTCSYKTFPTVPTCLILFGIILSCCFL